MLESETQSIPVIAIDGPSGSGKGTVAGAVAAALGWHLLDSGALYRVVGHMCTIRGVDSSDESAVAVLADALAIEFRGTQVFADDLEVTDAIRTEEAGVAASKVAAMPTVRDAISDLQHRFRQMPGLVADGRDMGTVVFTDAAVKIFLDASAKERADRRYKQLKNKGLSVSLRDLLAQIQERDERDTQRVVAPLRPADDATVIDSTRMTFEEVLSTVMKLVVTAGFKPLV